MPSSARGFDYAAAFISADEERAPLAEIAALAFLATAALRYSITFRTLLRPSERGRY